METSTLQNPKPGNSWEKHNQLQVFQQELQCSDLLNLSHIERSSTKSYLTQPHILLPILQLLTSIDPFCDSPNGRLLSYNGEI